MYRFSYDRTACGTDPRRPGRRPGFAPAFVWILLTVGCTTVNPQPDFRRAAERITERIGSQEVYDPAADALVAAKVTALLADGLTVPEAVQVAMLNNRAFQSIFQEIGMSRAELVQSSLLRNPTLALSLRFPEGGGRSNLSFTLVQQLVDLWQIPVRRRIARAQLERTVLNVVRESVTLAAAVETLYYRLVALQRAEMLTAEDLKLAQKSLTIAHDRFRAGETGMVDENLARVALLEVRRKMIALGGEIRRTHADLARVLGLARQDGPWALADDLPVKPIALASEADLLDLAMHQRLDAQAAALWVQAAQDKVREQILNILPNVGLGVDGERLERRALPSRSEVTRATGAAPTHRERELERRQIIDSLLGPALDITLPVWHQNQAQIARARYEVNRRRKVFEDVLDAVAQEVQKALAAAQTASELVIFFRDQALPLARKNVETARRAYQAGEQTIIALMHAQGTLIAQRAAYVEAQRDYAVALAELRRAGGGRLSSDAPGAATQPSGS